jgi:hypothetical protein
MILTSSQREKTQSIRDNVVGSEQLHAQADHVLTHDDPNCPECAAWRGRPDMVRIRAGDKRAEIAAYSGEL